MIKHNLRKKIYHRLLTQRNIFLLQMKCKTVKVAVFGKTPRNVLILKGTGPDRGVAGFPAGTRTALPGEGVPAARCVRCCAPLGDAPGEVCCASQEGNEENLRIYNNMILYNKISYFILLTRVSMDILRGAVTRWSTPPASRPLRGGGDRRRPRGRAPADTPSRPADRGVRAAPRAGDAVALPCTFFFFHCRFP